MLSIFVDLSRQSTFYISEMTKVNHFLFFILQVNFHGYALAGGGRGIERVELSVDGGKKWLEAHRLPKEKNCAQGLDDDPDRPQWAWVLWELKYIKVYPPTTVIVKAVRQNSYLFSASVST